MKRIATICAALTMALAACGDDDDDEASTPATTQEAKQAAPAGPFPSDPHDITCAHLADPTDTKVAKGSRRATFALADEAKLPDMNRLQASQSILFAMTELCKENGGSYKPAEDAVAAVKDGKYEADLGTP
jgi:hypothetical protein